LVLDEFDFGPLTIGGAENIQFTTGSIDELKVYNRGLSAAEVRSYGFVSAAAKQ
jgi:hypothetical protein